MADQNENLESDMIDVEIPEDAYEIENPTQQDVPAKKSKKVTAKTRKSAPDSISEDELDYIYEERRLYGLETKERQKYYRTKDAVSYFGEDSAKSELQKEKEEAQMIIAAVRAPKPRLLSGNVTGFSKTPNGIYIINVEITNGTGVNIVKIPFDHFIYYDKSEYTKNPDQADIWIQHRLEGFFGAKVWFVCYEYNEKEHVVYASRLAAMDIIARNYYLPVGGAKKPRLYEGLAANANIIAVYDNYIVVDVCGVDIELARKQLAWTALDRLTEEFEVGETIRVKVLTVSKPEKVQINNRTYHRYEVTASKRDLERKPEDIYFNQFNVGDRCRGVIRSDNLANGIMVRVNDKMDCFCKPIAIPPVYNSTCVVIITGKYNNPDGTKRLTGNVVEGTVRPPKPRY